MSCLVFPLKLHFDWRFPLANRHDSFTGVSQKQKIFKNMIIDAIDSVKSRTKNDI